MTGLAQRRKSLGAVPDDEIPIANPLEVPRSKHDRKQLFRMWMGAYGDHHVYIWADHFEDAFEEMVEFFDRPETCGLFTYLDEGDLKASAQDLGIHWPTPLEMRAERVDSAWGALDERTQEKIREHAEVDLTIIGHTTLKCGDGLGTPYVASWEWGGNDVTGEEYDLVRAASEEAYLEEYGQDD